MRVIQFDAPTEPIIDPESKLTVKARCVGRASLAAALDDAAVKAAIVKHVGAQLARSATAGQSLVRAASSPSLTPTVEAAVCAELKTSVQIAHLHVSFDAATEGAMKATVGATGLAPSVSFPPGARVLATWEDGRSFPATVRSFNGTHYLVVWEGSTTSVWLPPAALRPC